MGYDSCCCVEMIVEELVQSAPSAFCCGSIFGDMKVLPVVVDLREDIGLYERIFDEAHILCECKCRWIPVLRRKSWEDVVSKHSASAEIIDVEVIHSWTHNDIDVDVPDAETDIAIIVEGRNACLVADSQKRVRVVLHEKSVLAVPLDVDVGTQADVRGIRKVFRVADAPDQGPSYGRVVCVVVEELFPHEETYLGRELGELWERPFGGPTRLVGLGIASVRTGLLLLGGAQRPRRHLVGAHFGGGAYRDRSPRMGKLANGVRQ